MSSELNTLQVYILSMIKMYALFSYTWSFNSGICISASQHKELRFLCVASAAHFFVWEEV